MSYADHYNYLAIKILDEHILKCQHMEGLSKSVKDIEFLTNKHERAVLAMNVLDLILNRNSKILTGTVISKIEHSIETELVIPDGLTFDKVYDLFKNHISKLLSDLLPVE